MRNQLKELLKEGKTLLGSFITMNNPDGAEIMAMAGYDFLIIDCEHGPMSVESATHLIRAAEVRGVPSIIRVKDGRPETILRSLDIGATGVQVPQVGSGAMAAAVADASHYHPVGHRGLAMPRAADFGRMQVEEYFQKTREELLVIAQCESAEGLVNIEAVAATSGIDVVFLGPFDLSHSLGIPGQVEDPQIKAAERKVLEVCERHGKAAGIFAVNGEAARLRAKEGFRYVTIATDAIILGKAAAEEVKAFRGE